MNLENLGSDIHIKIASFLGHRDLLSLTDTCKSLALIELNPSVRTSAIVNDIEYIFTKRQPKFKPLTTTRCQIVEVTYANVAIGDIVLVLRTRESGRVFHSAILQAYAWGGMHMVMKALTRIDTMYPVWLSFYRLLFSEGYHELLIEYITHIFHDKTQEEAERSIAKALRVHNKISAAQITTLLGVSFNTAVAYNFVAMVGLLLRQKRVDPVADAIYALKLAAYKGHADVVSMLLKNTTSIPDDDESLAFRLACYEGHAETVKRMLADGRSDPSHKNSKCLRMASCYGHTQVVRLLLEDGRADPGACDSMALQLASENNQVQVVRLLLSDHRSNAMANKNYALNIASRLNHTKVEAMLVVAILGDLHRSVLRKSERKSLQRARKILRVEPEIVEKSTHWKAWFQWCSKGMNPFGY